MGFYNMAAGDYAYFQSLAQRYSINDNYHQMDAMIVKRLATVTDANTRASLTRLLGTVAIANAKLAYQRYLEFCRTAAWQQLAAKGAHPQRLLWASTRTRILVPRRPLRRRTDRARHGEHDSACDARSFSRSWPTASQPGRGRRGRAQRHRDARANGHFAQRRDQPADRRRRDAVQRGLRHPARGRRYRTSKGELRVDARPAALRSSRSIPPAKCHYFVADWQKVRQGAVDCGRVTRHCGPAATKATGSTGSGITDDQLRISVR